MNMQTAFCNYFDRLQTFSKKRYGTAPTVSFTEDMNPILLISEPNEDGDVEWQPAKQSKSIDWDSIEKEFGFQLSGELKAYYGEFWFLSLSGVLYKTLLTFYPIEGKIPVEETIRISFYDAQHEFPNSEKFLIGNACVADNDAFFIYYDNATAEVFCFDSELSKRVSFEETLSEIINSMEARD